MTRLPIFEEHVIADKQDDGYWVEAVDINGNGRSDLVTSGLAVGNVVWYENPGSASSQWRKRPIASLPKPVAIHQGDIDGDGRTDLVISHNYGNCMFWCRPTDGKISWLRNPGSYDDNRSWDVLFIDDLMATHRVKLGHFTQQEKLELIALPVVGHAPFGEGVHDPVTIRLYTVPDNVREVDRWPGHLVDDTHFRIIHGVWIDRYPGPFDPPLESMLFASEEGISWFYYGQNGSWQTIPIGSGDQTHIEQGFRGCGNVAAGRIGDDPYAYIATIDPFHGNVVTVYTRPPGNRLLTDSSWTRVVLDKFGEFSKETQGPGHHVVTGDFDGDGDDEFLVALRGPMPHQGVFYYKAIDAEKGWFDRTRVSSSSAARIAVGDFDGDGRLDFATTGYYTPGYYLADNPQVVVFYNRIG